MLVALMKDTRCCMTNRQHVKRYMKLVKLNQNSERNILCKYKNSIYFVSIIITICVHSREIKMVSH